MKQYLAMLGLLSPLAFANSEWQMVWNDEFDKDGAPDPQKWGYEESFVRNKEEQYYTKDRRENARVEKGCLVIEARKEEYKNPKYSPEAPEKEWSRSRAKADYTSASLHTNNLASWQYGKFEIRAKLPEGQGSWPAIWMMGTDRSQRGWPACGEIDIMEFVSGTPTTSYSTAHWTNPEFVKQSKPVQASTQGDNVKEKVVKPQVSQGFKIKNDSLTRDFHLYGMEWDEKEIRFLFDNKLVGTYLIEKSKDADGKCNFQKPFYLILNLAIGGSWGGKVDPAAFPRQYLVDYVRIYKKTTQSNN